MGKTDLKLLLVGNPNAGKSTLFNQLTGGHARVGNWHGVTVGALEGKCMLGGKEWTVCDLPGIYASEGMSMEEKLTRDYLASHDGIILFVAECAGLERALPLFFELAQSRPALLILTKKERLEREGGRVDERALSSCIGVPVLSVKRRSKTVRRDLENALPHAAVPQEGNWRQAYRPPKEGLSRADKLLTQPLVCLPFFFLLIFLAFLVTFAPCFPGAVMKDAVESFFTDFLGGYAGKAPPLLKSFLTALLSGVGSVLSFLPQIALLYTFLIVMEESGLLSRLAYLTDGIFSGVGLNGRAIFSLLMGFGCTAVAVTTTRGLDDRRMQRRAILCLPYIPCSAKLPVFVTIASSVFPYPFPAVLLLYALGVGLSLFCAKAMRGERMPFLMELAPLQFPDPLFVWKALRFQLKQFIIKTATVILAFFLFSWLLSSFDTSFRLCEPQDSLLAKLCGWLWWLFAPVGMGDWRIAWAALSGLIAKENVAGAIAMFYGSFPYGGASAAAFAVFMLTCSPCISAVVASAREVGKAKAVLYAMGQTVSALLLCYLTYYLCRGLFVPVLLAAVPICAFVLVRDHRERVRRNRGYHSESVHG